VLESYPFAFIHEILPYSHRHRAGGRQYILRRAGGDRVEGGVAQVKITP